MTEIVKYRNYLLLTRYRLAELADVDASYLGRLETGHATGPGRDVIMRLGRALADYSTKYTRKDVDRLLAMETYAPSPDWFWSLPAGEFGAAARRTGRYSRWRRTG